MIKGTWCSLKQTAVELEPFSLLQQEDVSNQEVLFDEVTIEEKLPLAMQTEAARNI